MLFEKMKFTIAKGLAAVLIVCTSYFFAYSQPCGFEQLFNIQPGMEKSKVLTLLTTNYRAVKTDDKQRKVLLPYSKTKKDSALLETITYRIDSSACFQGHRRSMTLAFADSKLFKVYLVTEFGNVEKGLLLNNFNELRTRIISQWEYEKAINFKNVYLQGEGYLYSKTRKKEKQPEMVTLQYVHQKGNEHSDPGGTYLLEIIWSNLKNTKMQGTAY